MGYLKSGIYSDEQFENLLDDSIEAVLANPNDGILGWLKTNMERPEITADLAEGGLCEVSSITTLIEGTVLEKVLGNALGAHAAGWMVLVGIKLGLVKMEELTKVDEKGEENTDDIKNDQSG